MDNKSIDCYEMILRMSTNKDGVFIRERYLELMKKYQPYASISTSKKEICKEEANVIRKLIEEDINKINIINDKKNKLIMDAYNGIIDSTNYYKYLKELLNLSKNYIETLNLDSGSVKSFMEN